MSKKILIAGYYGFSNSGDDAVLASICRDIEKKGSGYEARILSNMPEKTSQDYGFPAVDRTNPITVIKEIIKAEVLLMGGGSLLQDVTSSRSLYYYLTLLVIAKVFRTKTILYANGIGPIRKKGNRWLAKWVINRVSLITLRERLSFDELKRIGVVKPDVHVTSDPVFNLDVKLRDVDGILKDEKIPTDKPLVAIFFRTWGRHSGYIKKTAKLCDYITQKYDMNILFVPMKHPSDLKVSEEIGKLMTSKAYYLKNKYDSDTLIELIGQTHFVISMRLHALLYAAIKSVPMIGFVYDPKVKYYLQELDMYAVEDMNHFDEKEVEGFVDDIITNYEEIKLRIEEVTDIQRKQSEKNIEHLIELVDR